MYMYIYFIGALIIQKCGFQLTKEPSHDDDVAMLPHDLDNHENSIPSEDEDKPKDKITKVGISA